MTPPPRRPDVVLLVNSLAGGGAELAMVLLANELSARGYAVALATWVLEDERLGSHRRLVSDAVRQERLTPARMSWTRALRIARYLRAVGYPPLLTALPTANLAGLALKVALGRRARVVARIDSHMSSVLVAPATGCRLRFWYFWHNRLLRYADAVVCLNEEMAEDLRGHAPGAASRMVVIPNPAPVSDIRERAESPPHPSFAELAGGDDGRAPVIVSVGRLSWEKDQATLLRAFARLGPAPDGVMPRLLLLGEGPERGRLEALAAELGVNERLRMPGFVDNPYACMARARLVAQTSVYEGRFVGSGGGVVVRDAGGADGFPGARELLRGRDWLGEMAGVGMWPVCRRRCGGRWRGRRRRKRRGKR